MTIEDLRSKGLIILECVSGSKAYGLNTPTSDTDIKGVFVLPKSVYYGLNYIPQISNESNDIVFYELGRFMELISVNNPNILELLNTPADSIIYRHPLFENIGERNVLSKLCRDTFGKFALSQIKKAKGLNKKIVNPIAKERKTILEFCFVSHDQGSIPLLKFLELRSWDQKNCGLINIPHMKDLFGLYHSPDQHYAGVVRNSNSQEVCLSSIPAGEKQEAVLYFNKDGYTKYCKEYT